MICVTKINKSGLGTQAELEGVLFFCVRYSGKVSNKITFKKKNKGNKHSGYIGEEHSRKIE